MALEIRISTEAQLLDLGDATGLVRRYDISTSKFGLGFGEGSFKTPTGSFRISEKIGEGAPLNTIFQSRLPIGRWDPAEPTENDLVLTRILRLEGLDAENANTLARFIYIHGTNQEDLIGTPASHGCVRMRNRDLVELFELVPIGTPVFIQES